MTQPLRAKDYRQQSRSTEIYIWLGRNMIPVGILLVLVTGGIITLFILDMRQPQDANKQEVHKAEKTKSANKDWRARQYGNVDCPKDPHCRQFKRIYEDGGASEEAILKNILAADKSLTFEQLQQNAAQYEGMPWAFEGKLIDIIYQERRGINDYIVADVIIGEDEGKQISVKGDFTTDLVENDYVYVVGYITGTSHPRLGPTSLKFKGKVPSLSARALLDRSKAREILKKSGTY